LDRLKSGQSVSSINLSEKISNFCDIYPVEPVIRKTVKETVAEKRPTYFEMAFISLGEYQRLRKEGLIEYFRRLNVPEMRQAHFQTVLDNEVERMKIVKEEDAEYRKIYI